LNSEPLRDAHFAAFPQALVRPCILAGTSEAGCCAACGKPWERVREREGGVRNDNGRTHSLPEQRMGKTPPPEKGWESTARTVGWQKECRCATEEMQLCLVLDPFAGSGTVGKVATDLGRRSILIDLKPDYIELAHRRNSQLGLGL
jgi:hypothetical protein